MNFGPQGEMIPTQETKAERELRELQRDVAKLEREKKFFAPDEFRKRMGKLHVRMALLAESGAVKLPETWYIRHLAELRAGLGK